MSSLDTLIPGEVRNDGFSRAMTKIAATPGVRTILEIGASWGEGSTEALARGALLNPERPTIHSIEVSRVRHAALAARWAGHSFMKSYNVSSVPLEAFPTVEQVTHFYRTVRSRLRNNRLEKVLGWLEQDLEYLRREGLSAHGIREIKHQNGIDVFDAVVIDGSEFTGEAELAEVYGARFLLLDDTRSYKNWNNVARLTKDPGYRLVTRSRWRRNGFAVLEKRG